MFVQHVEARQFVATVNRNCLIAIVYFSLNNTFYIERVISKTVKTYERSVFNIGRMFNFFFAAADHRCFHLINIETRAAAHVNFPLYCSPILTKFECAEKHRINFRPRHSVQNVHAFKTEIRILGRVGYYSASPSLPPTA